MKISKLLVLSALGLVCLSANAADLVSREAPSYPGSGVAALTAEELENLDKTPATVALGKAYVMYNVDAQLAWLAGNNYSTRASIGPWASTEGDTNNYSAAVVYFVQTSEAALQGEGVVELKNWVPKFSEFRSTFGGNSGDGDIWTDNNSRDDRFWTISDQGNNTYRVANFKNGAGKFLGWNGTEDYTLYLLDPETYATGINWQFYEVTDWTSYLVAVEVYNKSKTLKSTIETAEAQGIDVSAAAAVYNNLDATVEQIEAAIAALQATMVGGIGNGTADNPTDATSLINNPNFDNASSAGWSGSTPNMTGSGAHGPANVAEFYQGNNVDMYQELSGMPAGVYRLTMYGMYRSGNADPAYTNFINGTNYRALLYASADDVELSTAIVNPFEIMNKETFAGATDWGVNASESASNGFRIPNDPSCARVYFNKGWYNNTVFFYVEGGNARIGVKEPGNYIAGDWLPFDEFHLTYFGNTQASFQKWVELSAPDYSNAVVTASLLSNYQSTVSSLAGSASDRTSAAAAVEQINELVKQMKENQSLWAQYLAKVDEATAFIAQAEFASYASDLADYLGWDAEDYINNRDLDSDGLKAEIEHIDQMIAEVRKAAAEDVKVDEEVTERWLTNANFANSGKGWTVAKGGCNYNYGIAEAYGAPFDIYQEVQNAKKGVYELQLQGFFRTGRAVASFDAYQAGTQKCDAGVYIGTADATNKTYLSCVFSEIIDPSFVEGNGNFLADGADWPDGNFYANDMQSAAKCFQEGMYKATAYGIVKGEGETMRIGVGGNLGGSDWICWDNFRLIYRGYENANANAYLLNIELENLNSLDMSKKMGKSVLAAVEQAKKDAQDAIGSGDAARMFDVLSDIYDLKSKIDASVALFADLFTEIQGLQVALSNTDADETVQAEVGAILEDLQTNYMKGEYDDADVPGLIARIAEAMAMLNMPSDIMSASDANPIDATKLVQSATYSEEVEGDAGIIETNQDKGWQGDAGSFGNDDTQKAALLYEFYNKTFDHYQVIGGMPAGAWEIKVNAFARFGSNDVDYKSYLEGATNNTFLYTEVGGVRRQVALPFLFAGADNFDSGVDGSATLNVDANGEVVASADEAAMTYWMPGSMVTARAYFDQYKYGNSIIVVVPDEGNGKGTLRFGIYKPTKNEDYDWVIMDDWSLTFYGASSTKESTGTPVTEGIETAAAAAKAVKTEYFTLDGRKAGAAQKGIVIVRQTMNNGNVVVRKIQK